MRILLVEDAALLARSLAQGLREEGFSVDIAADGEDGLHLASEVAYDAMILDRMLPKLDGLKLLERLRSSGVKTPVLMLTALGEIRDKVTGLNQGADDYVVKPVAFEELLARVRSLVRRSHGQPSNVVEVGELRLDLEKRSATVSGRALSLTTKELAVLELLALNVGVTMSRARIAERIYDEDSDRDSNVIDVFIARLRKKLDAVGVAGAMVLRTHRGEGFRLDPESLGVSSK
ncbi:MAG: response regulator transcription factor [Deltaproteobacteria bacterium]|nr:response regulator transcription factor [Deltaproteobacteria bacterium]